MASACVNSIGMSPEKFPAVTYSSYGWLSPRLSFSRDDDSLTTRGTLAASPAPEILDLDLSVGDFEFRLQDPVAMLPADKLFSHGKLVPLQVSAVRSSVTAGIVPEIRSPETAKHIRSPGISEADPYLFSPKAPSCSSRWKELLGLKKLYQNASLKNGAQKPTSSNTSSSGNPDPKCHKHFFHRSSKSSSSVEAMLNVPLLRDSDCESVSLYSSRRSLSSLEHDGLHRHSLDAGKPNPNPKPARKRLVKPAPTASCTTARVNSRGRSTVKQAESSIVMSRGVSVDSPRMNSSGKIVFHSLERSSSSPSSFNGGPRLKHRGMERSYSANVRIAPVLNVPICSLRGSKSGSAFGFGHLFGSSCPQKRDGNSGGCNSNRGHHYHHHHHHHQQQQHSTVNNRNG